MKKLIFAFLFATLSTFTFAQKNDYQLSSHILDVSKGMPANDVKIKLEKLNETNKVWYFVDEKMTDENGRIGNFLKSGKDNTGIYRFTYYTAAYFQKAGVESFYPFIEVVFQIQDDKHYHVPITLSAYGYATYRGN